jgi:hypothetical protein
MKVSGEDDAVQYPIGDGDGDHFRLFHLPGTHADRQSCSGHVREEVAGRAAPLELDFGKRWSRWAGRCHRMFICIMHCVKKEKMHKNGGTS